jgi:hypothetical protein
MTVPRGKGCCSSVTAVQEEAETELEIDMNPPSLGISDAASDLLIQIFCSLDHPQDLLRCESVCSSWRWLISTSNLPWDNMLFKKQAEPQYFYAFEPVEDKCLENAEKGSKLRFKECYELVEREEKRRMSQLAEWAGDLWHEYELGLSSCTS